MDNALTDGNSTNHDSQSQWEPITEALVFQFGPWSFAKWRFSALSNRSNPLVQKNGRLERPTVRQPVTYQQLRDNGTISRTLSFDRDSIRYVPYRGKRYFIEIIDGSFDRYLLKFSGKTRNTLQRKINKFAKHCGGEIDLRFFRSPQEMDEFRRHAITVSIPLYQKKIGWPFPKSDEYRRALIEDAERGSVCGFVLMYYEQPVAFAFCRIDENIITYTIPAYDQEFAQYSPGTVLLYLMLQRVFAERRFRIFDFGGQEWDYKALFATRYVDYLRVIWLPITAKNLILVAAHYSVRQAWHMAAGIKRLFVAGSRRAGAFLAGVSSLKILGQIRTAAPAPAVNVRKNGRRQQSRPAPPRQRQR